MCELEISPENLLIFSHSLAIKILIFLVILLIVFSEILVNSAIFTASMSDEKYHKISLNFFSEIRERTIYLFFNFATLVTFQEHIFHRNLLLLMFILSSVELKFILVVCFFVKFDGLNLLNFTPKVF